MLPKKAADLPVLGLNLLDQGQQLADEREYQACLGSDGDAFSIPISDRSVEATLSPEIIKQYLVSFSIPISDRSVEASY